MSAGKLLKLATDGAKAGPAPPTNTLCDSPMIADVLSKAKRVLRFVRQIDMLEDPNGACDVEVIGEGRGLVLEMVIEALEYAHQMDEHDTAERRTQ